MVPGGAAGLAAEQGGRNALYVRVDIGSLEVGLPLPAKPLRPYSASHTGEPVRIAGNADSADGRTHAL